MSRKEKLILEHLTLVYRRARVLQRKLGGDLEEFRADGMLGLIEAAERYDPAKNNNFSIWATRRIDGAIMDAYRKLDYKSRGARHQERKNPSQVQEVRALSRRIDLDDPAWGALMAVAGTQIEELEKKYWRQLIAILPTRLRNVMRMYYFEDMTDPQIGLILGGRSGSSVCRLRLEAIAFIRDYLREKGLLDGG